MQNVLTKSQVSVVELSGHINAANATELQERLRTVVMSDDQSALLIDMSLVESLDSAGLMALVSALTLSQQVNRQFGLCGVSPSIRIIFELTQLDRLFEMFQSRAAFESSLS